MVISALLTQASLLLAQSSSSTVSPQKSGQSLLSNAAGSSQISPRTGPDTYTPSQLNPLNDSAAAAFYQTPYAQQANASDALTAAVATAQKDANTAAQVAQNSGASQAAFSQLSRDMATLSTLMQADSASQSGSGTTAASIVITASSGAGSIAAIASDSANSSGNEETSSVALVGADGQVTAAGQGSRTTANGATTAASIGYSVSAASDASNGLSIATTAYSMLGTQADPASAMQWVGVLLNSDSRSSADAYQAAASAAGATVSGNSDPGASLATYASMNPVISSGPQYGYSPSNGNSSSGSIISVYA